ncbi:zinc metallopeptidase [Neolewinella aurantiaca]|uniref:Zinc metallopeptidase n=1 Tax=Neolewinella aurantiaca TaxID=2602767 RepID=A0A5C7FQM0_9BACT|nr:zinc metallopeptidase [Neolewinella aurantiaca]TXF88736.1 zinc metallopeptidase [Neolewinella aurantiaca]
MFSGGYITYIIITMIFAGIGSLVSKRLKSKFKQYSKVPMTGGLTGAEVAAKMLSYYRVDDVKIVQGQGFLTDHYNPATKTVSLSPEVYNGRHVSAAAVASHECGHAVQHAEAYAWLGFRSAMVPVVQVASRMQSVIFMAAIALASSALGPTVMLAAICVFGATTLFAVITLPVEFDASRRALNWLDESRVATGVQHAGAKDALWWAAMTYVVSALSSVAVLGYLVLSYLGSRD